MKLNGFVGKGTGKLGSSVFAVSGGEQIVRQYNPNVSNPSTDAQVAQRAKLKLMSQMAAAMGPIIAFKKEGLVSARNKFISANIDKCTFENDKANINLTEITLTGSSIGFPEIAASAGNGGNIAVALQAAAAQNIGAVVYVQISHDGNEKVEILQAKVVTEAGNDRTFPSTLNDSERDVIIYAYGVANGSASSNTRFDNYVASASRDESKLEVVTNLIVAGGNPTSTTAVKFEA